MTKGKYIVDREWDASTPDTSYRSCVCTLLGLGAICAIVVIAGLIWSTRKAATKLVVSEEITTGEDETKPTLPPNVRIMVSNQNDSVTNEFTTFSTTTDDTLLGADTDLPPSTSTYVSDESSTTEEYIPSSSEFTSETEFEGSSTTLPSVGHRKGGPPVIVDEGPFKKRVENMIDDMKAAATGNINDVQEERFNEIIDKLKTVEGMFDVPEEKVAEPPSSAETQKSIPDPSQQSIKPKQLGKPISDATQEPTTKKPEDGSTPDKTQESTMKKLEDETQESTTKKLEDGSNPSEVQEPKTEKPETDPNPEAKTEKPAVDPTPGVTQEAETEKPAVGPTPGETQEAKTEKPAVDTTPGKTQETETEKPAVAPTPVETQDAKTEKPAVGPTPGETQEVKTEKPAVDTTPGKTQEAETEKPAVDPTPGETQETKTEKPAVDPTPGETQEAKTEKPVDDPTPSETQESKTEKPAVDPTPSETQEPKTEKPETDSNPSETQEAKTENPTMDQTPGKTQEAETEKPIEIPTPDETQEAKTEKPAVDPSPAEIQEPKTEKPETGPNPGETQEVKTEKPASPDESTGLAFDKLASETSTKIVDFGEVLEETPPKSVSSKASEFLTDIDGNVKDMEAEVTAGKITTTQKGTFEKITGIIVVIKELVGLGPQGAAKALVKVVASVKAFDTNRNTKFDSLALELSKKGNDFFEMIKEVKPKEINVKTTQFLGDVEPDLNELDVEAKKENIRETQRKLYVTIQEKYEGIKKLIGLGPQAASKMISELTMKYTNFDKNKKPPPVTGGGGITGKYKSFGQQPPPPKQDGTMKYNEFGG